MKVIHVDNSYNIWSVDQMKQIIDSYCDNPSEMGRTYNGMYIEWYLHNIGYYATLPFTFIDEIEKINLRFRDVDLESHNE